MVRVVEDSCGRSCRLPTRAEKVAAIVARIAAEPGITRVDTLADRLGTSVRRLQRSFAEHVGVSPKWVIRRYRGGEDGRAGQTDRDLRRAGTRARHGPGAGPATRTDRSRPELDALTASANEGPVKVSGCGRRPESVARPVRG